MPSSVQVDTSGLAHTQILHFLCDMRVSSTTLMTPLGALCCAISAATYRGAKCPTLKTAENSRKRCRVGPGQTAGKTAEKQSRQLFFGCFGCFSGCFSAVVPRPPRHLFRLFFGCFQCRAFGTSVGGRRDCKLCAPNRRSQHFNDAATKRSLHTLHAPRMILRWQHNWARRGFPPLFVTVCPAGCPKPNVVLSLCA